MQYLTILVTTSLKIFIDAKNTMSKKKVGEERVYLAYASIFLFIMKKFSTGILSGREPGSRN